MPPGYFAGNCYMSHEKWTQLWQSSARLNYQPIVHIKAVRPKKDFHSSLNEAILEVIKYTTKPKDVAASASWLYELTQQMHNVRAISVGGIVSQFVSQAMLDRIESSISTGDEVKQQGGPVVYRWSNHLQFYDLVRMGSQTWS